MVKKDIDIKILARWDADSFRELYDHYYKALVDYAFQYVGETQASEDIVQSLFANFCERNTQFTSVAALENFLYSAVKNASLNLLKHKSVETTYFNKLRENGGKAKQEQYQSEEAEIFQERVYRLLFETIDQLPPKNRKVFLMYMEGKTNKEIAEALGISTETVKTHKKRGMKFLRSRLDPGALSVLMAIISVSAS